LGAVCQESSVVPGKRIGGKTAQTLRHLPVGLAVAPLPLLDAAGIGLSLWGAYYLRFRVLPYHNPVSPGLYFYLTLLAIPTWLVIFALYRLYDRENLFGGLQEYAGVVNACTVGLVGIILYGFLDRQGTEEISRGWLALVWGLSVITIGTTRFLYRRLIYRLRRRGLFTRRVLIVGTNDEGRYVAEQLRAAPQAGMEIVGFLDPRESADPPVEGLPVWRGLNALGELVRQQGIEEVIVVPTALRREELLELYRDWGKEKCLRIRLSSGLYELFTTGVQVQEVGFVPLVSLNRTRITGMDALMKAVLDYVGAALLLVLLSPLFLFIALSIRLDSPGPIIHRRRVVGLNGRVFDAYKFRTMIVDADTYLENHPELKREWEETGKIRNDPRVTRVGKWLRRTSLDELPQLVNVLKGQMSLVGPRMITPAELARFGRWQHNLLTVKPGLTGLWQVSGRADLSYEERVRLDMYYIRNYTIWLDLRLLLHTVRVVLQGKGAY
jgi:exopolysaccharide biosynthesis polyprenyl glycosylphosphotransferase